jgi:hypothetical protein
VDSELKSAMLDQVNDLVESAQQGKGKVKVVKFVPYVRVTRQTLRNPPSPPSGEAVLPPEDSGNDMPGQALPSPPFH